MRFYDEIGLLRPAYIAENGYRYYQEKQLLLLQQILFFRELGFELKQIQTIMEQSNFDQLGALREHKKVLRKNITRMTTLMKTIDNTINHLEGKETMDGKELFKGFTTKQLEEYSVQRWGKELLEDSKKKTSGWTWDGDWKNHLAEIKNVIAEIESQHKRKQPLDSQETQAAIKKHFELAQQTASYSKSGYIDLGKYLTEAMVAETNLFSSSKVAQYMCDAMKIFAERNLN